MGGPLGALAGAAIGGGTGHAIDKAGDSAEENLKPYKDIESSDDTESVTDRLTHYD